uniref:Uncharacterized protein n=1 Tax=Anopheles quadriannulatus TaxID=34691 RepID=A0A182XPI5_ANOQN
MELRFLPNTLVEGDAGLARAATATANPIEGGWRRKKRNAALDAAPKQGDEPADGGGRTGDGSDEGDETTTGVAAAAAPMSHEPATNNNHQSIPNQQQQHHLQQQHIGGLPPLHHPSAATVAMNSCGIPQAQQQQQQQHQQQQQQQEQLMLVSMPHRRTLERTAVRPIPNGATMAYGVDPKLLLDGGQPTVDCRQSSIRRTRRGSGSVPGSPRIGRGPSSEFLQQQQQQQQGVTVARSPMPMRAAGMKRSAATRLGRAENMSSGSLNKWPTGAVPTAADGATTGADGATTGASASSTIVSRKRRSKRAFKLLYLVRRRHARKPRQLPQQDVEHHCQKQAFYERANGYRLIS